MITIILDGLVLLGLMFLFDRKNPNRDFLETGLVAFILCHCLCVDEFLSDSAHRPCGFAPVFRAVRLPALEAAGDRDPTGSCDRCRFCRVQDPGALRVQGPLGELSVVNHSRSARRAWARPPDYGLPQVALKDRCDNRPTIPSLPRGRRRERGTGS